MPERHIFMLAGPSNASILFNKGGEIFKSTYQGLTGIEAVLGVRSEGGSTLLGPPGNGPSWWSSVEGGGLTNTMLLKLSNLYNNTAGGIIKGIIWHNGSDQDNLLAGLRSLEDYQGRLADMLDEWTVRCANYGHTIKVCYAEAGVVPEAEGSYTEAFRQMEADIFGGRENGIIGNTGTTSEIVTNYLQAPTLEEKRRWFKPEEVTKHWGPDASNMIMERLAISLANAEIGISKTSKYPTR